MLPYIAERAERLHSICGRVTKGVVKPLLVEHLFTPTEFNILRNYVNIYLYNSLAAIKPGHYSMAHDFLHLYEEEIADLPNITPNGLLLPKKHNFLAYNMIYQFLVPLIARMQLTDIAQIQRSINIRIINGQPNSFADTRPRSSMKLHSDIWAGEFANHLTLQIPMCGDMARNGIDLYEPGEKFYPNYVRAMDDFANGAEVRDDATKYEVPLKVGCGYFMDSFLLHQTRKGGSGLRMNLSITFITKSRVSSDLVFATERQEEYIETEKWFGFGSDRIVTTQAEPRAFDAAAMSQVRNKYAEKYEVRELKD